MSDYNTILVNGCFDCLHSGHVWFLQQCVEIAKKEKSFIILAIDSDEKIQKDKGSDRPIFSSSERIDHITTLFPDIVYIVVFSTNQELEDLIKLYNPILVKSESWKGNVVGEKYAKEVIFIPQNKDLPSTTEIIKRVIDVYEYTRDR